MSPSSNKARALLTAVIATAMLVVAHAQTVTLTNYLWFFPHVPVASVTSTGATALITRLRTQVQKIFDTGRPGGVYSGLSPVYYGHHDRAVDEQYWLYVKRGRTIATLAWAYPWLDTAGKAAAVAYVQAELASATFQPWASGILQPGNGALREFHPITTRTFGDFSYASFPTSPPVCEQMYALWLWGWRRGGNWSDLTAGQASIRTWYTTIASSCTLYGSMGAHIAKARLETTPIWNNSGNQTTATNNLQTAMDNGLNFGNTELLVGSCNGSNATGQWSFQYCKFDGALPPGSQWVSDTRKRGGQYLGWMFYGIAPEVARYLSLETFTNPANGPLVRHASGKTKYPHWWLRQAGYDEGSTGVGQDIEGSGISPETICMIAPLERYAAGASAATMLNYARSGPYAIGDSCTLELWVYAIEAQGTMTWIDTRNGHPGT